MSAIDLFLQKTEIEIDYDIVVNTDSMELIEMMEKKNNSQCKGIPNN